MAAKSVETPTQQDLYTDARGQVREEASSGSGRERCCLLTLPDRLERVAVLTGAMATLGEPALTHPS